MEDFTQLTQAKLKATVQTVDELKKKVATLIKRIDELESQLKKEQTWRKELQEKAKNFLRG